MSLSLTSSGEVLEERESICSAGSPRPVHFLNVHVPIQYSVLMQVLSLHSWNIAIASVSPRPVHVLNVLNFQVGHCSGMPHILIGAHKNIRRLK